MKNKILSFLIILCLLLTSTGTLTLTAGAAWIGEDVPASDNYSYIANETFDSYLDTAAVEAGGLWKSVNQDASKKANFVLETEENGNKFLRYRRKSNTENMTGTPVHELVFSPEEKASFMGGKNVVIEYKLRSYVADIESKTVGHDNTSYSVRLNHIDRGAANPTAVYSVLNTLMTFSPAQSAGLDPNRYGVGQPPGPTSQNFGEVRDENWVSYKIEIDPVLNKITYSNAAVSATTSWHEQFWGMDALETLNFCIASVGGMTGSKINTGTLDDPATEDVDESDYFDVDDVKIYYSNPAPSAPTLMINSDEVILQFDRDIDTSTLNDNTVRVHSSSTAAFMGNNGTYYDASTRQYHLKLTPFITNGNWNISLAGANAYSYSNHKDNQYAVYSKNMADNRTDKFYPGKTWWNQPINRDATASKDASLKDLAFNGYSVKGFEPDKYEYVAEIPASTAVLPSIVATPTAEGAAVSVSANPMTWKGERITITVTAPDGVTKKNYYIKAKKCGISTDTLFESVTLTAPVTNMEIPAVDEVITSQLSLLALDNSGSSIDVDSVNYSVIGNPMGISVDKDGVLTVSEWASPGDYVIEAIITPDDDMFPWQSRIGGRATITLTGTTSTRPFIRDLTITGVVEPNGVLTLEPYTMYQADGNTEGTSLIEWLWADNKNGPYYPIENENATTYTVMGEYAMKFICARVTPVDNMDNVGPAIMSNRLVRIEGPSANNVTISGEYGVDEKWTVKYDYYDINDDPEGDTTFQWYRIKPDGTRESISGATSKTYTIKNADIDCEICATVTPVSVNDILPGDAVESNNVLVATYATASNLGTTEISDNLIGATYTYSHPLGIAEGNTRFEWYDGNSKVSSGDTLNITAYKGKTIKLVVYPYASKKPYEGKSASVTFTVASSNTEYHGGGGGGTPIKPSEETEPPVDTNTNTNPTTTPEKIKGVPQWAKEAVDFAVSNGLMTLGEDKDFGGDTNISRKEFLTAVMTAVKIEPQPYNNIFSDISKDDPFSNLLQAAVNSGIISEYDAFYPQRELSREEMCKIIVTAIKAASKNEIGIADISHFTDSGIIAGWAQEYVSKAVATGLIKGMSETEFAPKGRLTKAQTATILQRIVNYLNSEEAGVVK